MRHMSCKKLILFVYMSCVTKTASSPVNLRDGLPSDLRDRRRSTPGRDTPVEYPLPDRYPPSGKLSPSCCQGRGLSQSEASPPFSAEL